MAVTALMQHERKVRGVLVIWLARRRSHIEQSRHHRGLLNTAAHKEKYSGHAAHLVIQKRLSLDLKTAELLLAAVHARSVRVHPAPTTATMRMRHLALHLKTQNRAHEVGDVHGVDLAEVAEVMLAAEHGRCRGHRA